MDVIRVVQFLHPGPEHGWDRAFTTTTGWKDWNRGDHKRKFLVAEGSCTRNPRESPARGSFTFWGEWEPQSEVRRLVSNKGAHYPSWLHTPRLRLSEVASPPKQNGQMQACALDLLQNTDPLVFGDRFRYALCRQFSNVSGLPTALARLHEGDIILFGSNVAGCFALDTVFVVGVFSPVSSDYPLPKWESELHRRITMDLFEIPRCGLRLYGGQNWSAEKPFSFVPCLPIDRLSRDFSRPIIEPSGVLSNLISPKLKQNFKITVLDGARTARLVWDAVVQQVLAHGCALGTNVEEPADARGQLYEAD